MSARAAWLIGAVGAGLVAVDLTLPANAIGDALYVLIGLCSFICVAAAIAVRKPEQRSAWRLIALSQLTWVAADALYPLDFGLHPLHAWIPAPVDLIYLAGYPLLAVGLLKLRPWDWVNGIADLIDSAIAAIAIGLVIWVTIVVPATHSPYDSIRSEVVDIAYPLLDLLLLGLALRLVLGGIRQSRAGQLLTAAMVLVLAADLHYGATTGFEQHFVTVLTDGAWLLSYVLIAVAATHPSMTKIAKPASARGQRPIPLRLCLLAALSMGGLVIAMIEALNGEAAGIIVLAATGAALFLLATFRIGLLVRSVETATAEVRLRNRALESVGSGIVIIDATVPNGRFLDVNSAFERISGYDREELLGQSVRLLFGGGTDPMTANQLDCSLATGSQTEARVLSYRKNGESFWSEIGSPRWSTIRIESATWSAY